MISLNKKFQLRTHRELCVIVSALQTYEHYRLGSSHPIFVHCDHKPIIYSWGRRGKLSHRFFRYQIVITQFQNLKIVWIEGKNLAFPDILSRNVKLRELDRYHLQHEKIPKDIKFFDETGLEEKYFAVHDSERGKTNNIFPKINQIVNGKEKLRISESEIFSQSHTQNDQMVCSLSNINENSNFLG